MIVNALASLIYGLLDLLLVFNLPSLPDSVMTVANNGVGYIITGVGVLGAFLGTTALGVLAVLLSLLLSMHVAYMLYSLVAFILRKIPMLGVDM